MVRSKVQEGGEEAGEEAGNAVADIELEDMSSRLDSYMTKKFNSAADEERESKAFTMDGNAQLVYGSAIAVGGISGGLRRLC